MGIADVALRHAETVDRFPSATVVTRQHQNRRRGMNHVPIGATAKREIVLVAEPAQIGEGVVLAVVKHALDRFDGDGRRRGAAGRGNVRASRDRCMKQRDCD